MDTDYLAALRTGPPFFFVSDKSPYAEFPDVLKIIDHAHAVLCSISLVQVFKPCTGEAVTTEAVLAPSLNHLLTVPDPTPDA